MNQEHALSALNAPTAQERLHALASLLEEEQHRPVIKPEYANNHIHTIYSFSPYSPASAIYHAREAGLETAGIMDHDSVAGAEEFQRAGELAGVATTCGVECRVSLSGTPLSDRTINNPDQSGIAYMSLHGIPQKTRGHVQATFAPFRERRSARNRAMTEKMNAITASAGIVTDYDRDVLPLSMDHEGGTVTERHILFALAGRILTVTGGERVASFLTGHLGIGVSDQQKAMIEDPDNPFRRYDLLGLLKAELVEQIYLPAMDELMHVSDLKRLAEESQSLLFYPYLGDVGVSVTGDKKAKHYEDAYLDLLFDTLSVLGVDGVTYMPSRNTPAQLERVQQKIREVGLLEISGEDINSPRQSFICPQLAEPSFQHLVTATWDLIRREKEN